MQRWIIHIDMDAFFASIEQLDAPELRGKPVLVGGDSARSVVAAASYEARRFGVHSAMPMYQALRLCPQAIVCLGRRRRYLELSQQIMTILRDFSPLVEAASIDEAYLDASGLERLFGPIGVLCDTIQKRVVQETGLTASLGAAPIKFLAKIASDIHKPHGIYILQAAAVPHFLHTLPVKKIPGVGKVTLNKLQQMGISTAGEMAHFPSEFWERHLGKVGVQLAAYAQGIDRRAVEPVFEAKSESAENTFEHNISDREILYSWLLLQAERVTTSLRKKNLAGRTITLKVKYPDFTTRSKSLTLATATNSTQTVYDIAVSLLEELNPKHPLRLIGLGVSNFMGDMPEQLLLPLGDSKQAEAAQRKQTALDQTFDVIQQRFGKKALIRGRLLRLK